MEISQALKRINVLSIAALCLGAFATAAVAGDMTLEIINIKSDQGKLRIAIYNQETGFEKQLPYRAISQPAKHGTIKIVLSDLPMGQYGVMLFQDINENEKLDTNLLGIPNEPWSASLQGRSLKGAPAWQDISFTLPDNGDRIVIDMR